MRRHLTGRRTVLLLSGFLLMLTGCLSFDPGRVRREHVEVFSDGLAGQAALLLAQPVSLDACVRIAMANNYDVRKAELDRQLGQLARDYSFTAFLPNVAASAGYTVHAKEPMMQEKRAVSGSLSAGMPLVMPSTWFLYDAARQGADMTDLAAAYVRQGIVQQTTLNYFNVLVQEETIAALETQLESAREEAARVSALAEAGFFRDWERDQAVYLAERRASELAAARRALAVRRGTLLVDMGLSPLSEIQLSGVVGDFRRPEGTLEDLVLRALMGHPELALADRAVVIGEANVRRAFTAFLPTLSLTSSLDWTTDDLARHSLNWTTGLGAVWDVFSGFANLTRYREAKVERERTRIERESTFLSVMIRVISAEAAVDDAVEQERLFGQAYRVAAGRHADIAARAAEGLLLLSDALDARSEMEAAQVQWLRARHQRWMAIANLELAMGLTALPDADAMTDSGTGE